MTKEEATLDIPAAQSRLEEILVKEPGGTLTQVHPPPPTHPPAPNRKPRSDKGVPKKPPEGADDVTLKLNLNDARLAALAIGATDYCGDLAARIQNQIILQLQKKIDLLTKQK